MATAGMSGRGSSHAPHLQRKERRSEHQQQCARRHTHRVGRDPEEREASTAGW